MRVRVLKVFSFGICMYVYLHHMDKTYEQMKIMLAWILFGYFDELIIVCELVVAAKKTEFNWCGFGWVM